MPRKSEHIRLAADPAQIANEFRWWEAVKLVHQALPEISMDQVRLKTDYPCGNAGFPLFVVGMTGGTETAEQFNLSIGEVCTKYKIPMGLGSIRPLLTSGLRHGYDLKETFPDLMLYGNLGGTQLVSEQKNGFKRLEVAISELGLDAFCIHLNPAQEILQPEGDRDFTGVLAAITEFAGASTVPVIVKETGCGVSVQVAKSLARGGVKWIDVSGQGGTSWPWIENARSDTPRPAFNQWGIPAPVSLYACARKVSGISWIASGGIRNGIDALRALALGGDLVGVGRPLLSAWQEGGTQGLDDCLTHIKHELVTAAVLTGADSLTSIREIPFSLSGELEQWLELLQK